MQGVLGVVVDDTPQLIAATYDVDEPEMLGCACVAIGNAHFQSEAILPKLRSGVAADAV
jgi:hypothetical protein